MLNTPEPREKQCCRKSPDWIFFFRTKLLISSKFQKKKLNWEQKFQVIIFW